MVVCLGWYGEWVWGWKTEEWRVPRVKVHAQLVHVGRNVAASCVGCEGGLIEAEESGGERGDALLLQLAAGEKTFPGGRDLDADAAGIEVWAELLEVGDNSWAGLAKLV
jgi:hypothetical protein